MQWINFNGLYNFQYKDIDRSVKDERWCNLSISIFNPQPCPHIKQLCQENFSELAIEKLVTKLGFKHSFLND